MTKILTGNKHIFLFFLSFFFVGIKTPAPSLSSEGFAPPQTESLQHSLLYSAVSAAGHGVIGGLGHIRWGITVVIIFSTSLK